MAHEAGKRVGAGMPYEAAMGTTLDEAEAFLEGLSQMQAPPPEVME